MLIISTCVLKHLRWKSKTCQFASRSVVLKVFSSCSDTNCCRCADNFQIRIFLKKSCCLVCGFLWLVIAICNFYKLKLGIFVILFHNLLHSVDPCVLVCSLRSSGKNCELSLSTGDIKASIKKSLSYSNSTSLVDEDLTAVWVCSRVEAGDLDSFIHSFL